MKKLIVLIIALALCACAPLSVQQDVEDMRSELEQVKMMTMTGQAAANFYPARGLDGGAAGDLDKIAGTNDKDVGFVVLEGDGTYGNIVLVYVLDAASGDGDDLPHYLDAADNNDGGGGNLERWELVDVWGASTYGAIAVESDADGETVTEAQAYGGIILETGNQQTVLLPDSTTGMNFCVIADGADGSAEVYLDSNANDNFEIDGTTGDNGDYIVNSSDEKGDFMCVYSIDGTTWVLMGRNGTITHEP